METIPKLKIFFSKKPLYGIITTNPENVTEVPSILTHSGDFKIVSTLPFHLRVFDDSFTLLTNVERVINIYDNSLVAPTEFPDLPVYFDITDYLSKMKIKIIILLSKKNIWS